MNSISQIIKSHIIIIPSAHIFLFSIMRNVSPLIHYSMLRTFSKVSFPWAPLIQYRASPALRNTFGGSDPEFIPLKQGFVTTRLSDISIGSVQYTRQFMLCPRQSAVGWCSISPPFHLSHLSSSSRFYLTNKTRALTYASRTNVKYLAFKWLVRGSVPKSPPD